MDKQKTVVFIQRYATIGCLSLLLACTEKKTVADLIISGGTIYTMDDQQPTVEAVAVKSDKIIFVGSEKDVAGFNGKPTRHILLKGKTMTPGFIEGHGHFFETGFKERVLNLDSTKSYEELVAMVQKAAAKAKPGEWIQGFGWHQDKWKNKPQPWVRGFQTHDLLSSISPDNPVYLLHSSGHAALANAKAMQLTGILQLTSQQLSQTGGEVIRDQHGRPTGIFVEHAQSLIANAIPRPTREELLKEFELATASCLRNGITSFHDADVGREKLMLLKELHHERKLKVRLYEFLSSADRSLINDYFKSGIEIDATHWLTVRAIKLYADGALGSRGAWLLQPYSDRKETSGMPAMPMDSLEKMAAQALQAGFQVCTHAIGDRANHEVLDRYENALRENAGKAPEARFRIEHATVIRSDDVHRFAKLGVLAAVQGIFFSSDRLWAIDRLGAQRINESNHVWQSLFASGAHVINGTDTPVEPIDPIACFFASVTRQTRNGQAAGGYEPHQRMTRAQALKSYTLEPAYGAFEENIKGSIAVGKLADFTVFSQDLMMVPTEKILSTHVAMTIVGGEVVFERK